MSPRKLLRPDEKRARFRALLAGPEPFIMPGGVGPIHAMMAEAAGFESFFLAGSQIAAMLFGLPDVGLIGLRDVVDHARHVAARTDIPIMVDCDTGFGNAVNVHFSVQDILRSGASGLQIEDQEAPKKSGTSSGRRCLAVDEAVGKYRAAVAARDQLDPSFVICARTDAIGAERESFESAVERCVTYVREGRVDVVWLNSVQTCEQIRVACAAIPAPVLIAWGGEGPEPSIEEYRQLGARVAIHPTILSRVSQQATWDFVHDFKVRGRRALEEWRISRGDKAGPVDLRALLDYARIGDIESRFLPPELKRDYAGTWGHGGLNPR